MIESHLLFYKKCHIFNLHQDCQLTTMYKQNGIRAQRPGPCLLPGVVSFSVVLFLMTVFMIFSRNNTMMQMRKELSNARIDSLLVANNSQVCSIKLKISEEEKMKMNETIEILKKELSENKRLMNETKTKETILWEEKLNLQKRLRKFETNHENRTFIDKESTVNKTSFRTNDTMKKTELGKYQDQKASAREKLQILSSSISGKGPTKNVVVKSDESNKQTNKTNIRSGKENKRNEILMERKVQNENKMGLMKSQIPQLAPP